MANDDGFSGVASLYTRRLNRLSSLFENGKVMIRVSKSFWLPVWLPKLLSQPPINLLDGPPTKIEFLNDSKPIELGVKVLYLPDLLLLMTGWVYMIEVFRYWFLSFSHSFKIVSFARSKLSICSTCSLSFFSFSPSLSSTLHVPFQNQISKRSSWFHSHSHASLRLLFFASKILAHARAVCKLKTS